MLIGVNMVEIIDAENGDMVDVDATAARERIKLLQSGDMTIDIAGHKKSKLAVVERQEERERNFMVKYSSKCCCTRRERGFIIENMEIQVFKSTHKFSKFKGHYKLMDGKANLERKEKGTHQKPKFDEGYEERLKVVFEDRARRQKSPFWLYSPNQTQLRQWQRAFWLAKVLVSDND